MVVVVYNFNIYVILLTNAVSDSCEYVELFPRGNVEVQDGDW
jgi:hypothetical protein